MPKFDCLYQFEGVQEVQLDHPFRGMIYIAHAESECSMCHDATSWLNLDFHCALCSTECHDKLHCEYNEAMSKGQTREVGRPVAYNRLKADAQEI